MLVNELFFMSQSLLLNSLVFEDLNLNKIFKTWSFLCSKVCKCWWMHCSLCLGLLLLNLKMYFMFCACCVGLIFVCYGSCFRFYHDKNNLGFHNGFHIVCHNSCFCFYHDKNTLDSQWVFTFLLFSIAHVRPYTLLV